MLHPLAVDSGTLAVAGGELVQQTTTLELPPTETGVDPSQVTTVQHSSTSIGPRHLAPWIYNGKSSKVNSLAKNSCKATFPNPSRSVERLEKADGRASSSEEDQALGGVLISGGEPSTRSAYLYGISRAER